MTADMALEIFQCTYRAVNLIGVNECLSPDVILV
jgi:hypothetical protein